MWGLVFERMRKKNKEDGKGQNVKCHILHGQRSNTLFISIHLHVRLCIWCFFSSSLLSWQIPHGMLRILSFLLLQLFIAFYFFSCSQGVTFRNSRHWSMYIEFVIPSSSLSFSSFPQQCFSVTHILCIHWTALRLQSILSQSCTTLSSICTTIHSKQNVYILRCSVVQFDRRDGWWKIRSQFGFSNFDKFLWKMYKTFNKVPEYFQWLGNAYKKKKKL